MKDISQEDEIIVEAEEWNSIKVYTAGEYFTIGKELYKVVEGYNSTCQECDFQNNPHCRDTACLGIDSKDDVIFTLYDTLEEE